jgi:surfeit locus 1 family protein
MAVAGSDPAASPARRGARRPLLRWVLTLAGLVLFAGFSALGIWQVERRAWKLDLIARVEARLHAAPVPAPGPQSWPVFDAAEADYRRVTLSGRFLPDRDTLVTAVTELGGGYWVITPLRSDAGFTVLVNRGFVPGDRRDAAQRATPDAPVTVIGLLRRSEPGGGFLRANDAVTDRWYSRDVDAIAARRGLGAVAPYFIDAEAGPVPGALPVGGLTVVRFSNNHLVYALTWFTLALMVAAGVARLWADRWWPARGAGAGEPGD